MWYTGKDAMPLPAYPTPYFWDIGYAEGPFAESAITLTPFAGKTLSATLIPSLFHGSLQIITSLNATHNPVRIYDDWGRLIANLVLDKGCMRWDASRFPQGVYLITIGNGKQQIARKTMLLK
jgi:hypothetical protein